MREGLTRNWARIGAGLLLLALCAMGLLQLPGPRYIAKQAQGQLRLLSGRVPNERALRSVDFSEEERAALVLVPVIKRFGEQVIGLSPTRNYETINPTFDDVVWNVTACAADHFVAHVYRYPVVGELPYTGFFARADAEAERQALLDLGWEVQVRAAGAYSSLGWFRDPLWRSMLKWDEQQLSNTVLHELAHATIWLDGQGRFNESLASFLGDEASERYLRSIADARPKIWRAFLDQRADGARYRAFLHRLVQRLDALYQSGLPRGETLRFKERLISRARERYVALPWRLDGYAHAMDADRTWDNARLMGFRIYNTGTRVFQDALERFDGQLPLLIEALRGLDAQQRAAGEGWDPYAAVELLRAS